MEFAVKQCMTGLMKVFGFISVLGKFNAYFLSVKNHTHLSVINTFLIVPRS